MEYTGSRYVRPFGESVVSSARVGEKRIYTYQLSLFTTGRFLREYSADDLLFGNVFDRPFKLPWGFSAALKFMQYVPGRLARPPDRTDPSRAPSSSPTANNSFIDPTLEHDLASRSKPWALSPLIATMPYFQHKRIPSGTPSPAFPPKEPLLDDISQLRTIPNATAKSAKAKDSPSKRRGHYSNALRRQEIVFGPEVRSLAPFPR